MRLSSHFSSRQNFRREREKQRVEVGKKVEGAKEEEERKGEKSD